MSTKPKARPSEKRPRAKSPRPNSSQFTKPQDSRQSSSPAKTKIRAVTFPHPAGKGVSAQPILSQSPIRQGRKFIDLFAARANITFRAWAMGFAFSEWVLNDKDTSFLRALGDIGDKVKVPPRSREEFEKQKHLAAGGDQRAVLLAPWLCFNGGTYDTGGPQYSSPKGGRRTPESYARNLGAGHKLFKENKPQITTSDWLDCLEQEQPGPVDLVVIDGPYIECNVGPFEPDSILPIELIEKLKSATFNWILCEHRQPIYLYAFGEPIYQKELFNWKTGRKDRRVECVWTSESYKAHLAKSGSKRDTSRFAKPVPADRPATYYGGLPLEELITEIKECAAVITMSRLQMNVEMRKRLLPALLALRKRTYRKHPGYYETLASIGLNADTVRQWFYRSYTADEVIDLVEEKQPERVRGTGKTECRGGSAEEDEASLTQRFLLQADKIVTALLQDKITLAKRLGREYAEARKIEVGSNALRESKKAA